ncbi:hypothetical protein JOB18_007236 [Solea senegalensis]|uniref:Uncharacterized protein n=1 Tax=Solea senegalensis TaxID=28829 RepID=A0AAV6S6W7_SOLSE|nr:uncharacterized protein LOC122781404 [Solea senegalensis]XP_043900962.1 uncharacterized protein LOC122781404 [Solea senegalensis]XP_043900963.1 uncharacterized protein LOC122781404 [Solea senegalensis]KAG7511678.1 hypothetical protein JOB18_007236 [Solea senegalensis]KAG7511679.1 hypothetical protein JOB18_007236 [Solea senegalensis]KAG7511680.1 hypothetical protein JOB18_007236 [Solea senegalensis]KAG7511681.1 hypothetical protein JOB18_007236 [Solea senegalensis]
MGQLLSSEEEYSQVKDAIGSVLYNAMLEAGAVPDLGVVHPLLLANHNQSSDSRTRLQEQLQQLQGDIGNRAPAYLKDLIGRLTTFSDEPRLAGLVGLVVTLVMDMAYSSSRRSLGVKGKSATLSSCQERVGGVQEVMEEYLKRCRINLSNKKRLFEDSVRLEGQLSLTLTQLKTCMLRGDCDSRSLRHWASGAVFHIQLLVHLSALEGLNEPLVAREALEQYKDDLTEIIPAYRRHKSNTVCVMKCRGGLPASCDPGEVPEEGSVTGLTVTDSETGKSVTLPLNAVETETGRRRRVSGPGNTVMPSSINLDLITSDQYTQAYLDYLFSDRGPVAELESYFNKTKDNLQTLTQPGCAEETGVREQRDGEQAQGIHAKEQREDGAKGDKQDGMEASGGQEETEESIQRDESLKLSITETKPEKSLHHGASTT